MLTDTVGSRSTAEDAHNWAARPLEKTKKGTKKGRKKTTTPHRKVRVLGDAARPLPSLQTIPTVFLQTGARFGFSMPCGHFTKPTHARGTF